MQNKSEIKESKHRKSTLSYTVDSFDDGIAFGQHKLESNQSPGDYYYLRLADEKEVVRLRSRYVFSKENPLCELEKQLMRLSSQGILGSSTIYFGVANDPLYPFEGKFDASMKLLSLFKKYRPGMLHIQTRSPLLVIALPALKSLGKHLSVTVGLETNSEEAVARYTPGLPRIEDRLEMIRALRTFGIEVNIQAGPVLPYGDWRADAGKFAELLCENADYISTLPITDGTVQDERRLRKSAVAAKLAGDRKFHWLRPDATSPLMEEIQKIAPEKLQTPVRKHMTDRQLKIFAA